MELSLEVRLTYHVAQLRALLKPFQSLGDIVSRVIWGPSIETPLCRKVWIFFFDCPPKGGQSKKKISFRSYAQRSLFEILLNQTKIILYLPISDWCGTQADVSVCCSKLIWKWWIQYDCTNKLMFACTMTYEWLNTDITTMKSKNKSKHKINKIIRIIIAKIKCKIKQNACGMQFDNKFVFLITNCHWPKTNHVIWLDQWQLLFAKTNADRTVCRKGLY